VDRRKFLIGGLAIFGARSGHALQRIYRVGTLVNGPEKAWHARVAALRAGLKDLGYTEGRNLVLIPRWNDGGIERLADLAADLLREKPDVVVCGLVLSAAAVQKHSRAVPIVIGNGAGAVKIGLAKSFARPQTNVTGLETQSEELVAKNIELLKALAPAVSRLAVLNTGKYLFYDEAWQALNAAARTMKLELVDARVAEPGDLARLAQTCLKGGCDGLYVMPDPILINWRTQIVEQAAKLKLPAVYNQPEYVQAGGLVSYSANVDDMWRRAAGYVDKILKGAKPADLPIERPFKFELVINLKTAKSLGLKIPGDFLARADKIIE
jgi:putative ABC transport system substrate-binding protein